MANNTTIGNASGTYNIAAGDDSVFNATPAILDGQLLLRSDRYLYCIGKRHE